MAINRNPTISRLRAKAAYCGLGGGFCLPMMVQWFGAGADAGGAINGTAANDLSTACLFT